MQRIEPGEIREATIHHVETARLERDLVEDIDLVQLAVRDVNESRDVATSHGDFLRPHVEQRMKFDRRLGLAKARPREERQGQVDGRGVERIGRVVQRDAETLARVKLACHLNEAQCEAR